MISLRSIEYSILLWKKQNEQLKAAKPCYFGIFPKFFIKSLFASNKLRNLGTREGFLPTEFFFRNLGTLGHFENYWEKENFKIRYIVIGQKKKIEIMRFLDRRFWGKFIYNILECSIKTEHNIFWCRTFCFDRAFGSDVPSYPVRNGR